MFGLITRSAALFLVKSLLLGTRVIALLAIAKFGTPDELASASYVVALAEMFRLFADWGMDTWSIRAMALARTGADRARALTSALHVKALGTTMFSLLLLLICVSRFPQDGVYLGVPAVILLFAGQISGLAISYFQALDRLRKILFVALPCVITMFATVVVVIITRNAHLTLATLGTGELIMAGSLLRLLWRERALQAQPPSLASLMSTMRKGMPAAIMNLIIGLYSRLDTVILAQISTTALATYTVANRLFLPFQVAVTTLGAVIYAATASSIAARLKTSRGFYARDLPLTAVLSTVAGAILWFGGSALIRGYLPAFQAAIETLKVLCVLVIVLGCSAAVAARVLAHGRMSAIAMIGAVDLICASAAMFELVPSQGALGAAKALLIGACINLSMTLGYASFTIERHKPAALAR